MFGELRLINLKGVKTMSIKDWHVIAINSDTRLTKAGFQELRENSVETILSSGRKNELFARRNLQSAAILTESDLKDYFPLIKKLHPSARVVKFCDW
jgi:hypothetical protein